MSKAIAVIGANFGDEGKGLATDYFARKLKSPMVARGNGGAQAGHTVVDGDNRHVFGHVGSGTFAGASTYLGAAFIANPLTLFKELKKLGTHARIYAHPECRVTTIYDMAINSLIELKRGVDRHGSCGQGINETVTRHLAGFHLTMLHVTSDSLRELAQRVEIIRDKWVPMRMLQLDISRSDFDTEQAKLYFEILDMRPGVVAEQLMHHGDLIKLVDPKALLKEHDTLVVEGAQGLMLDEFLGDFPHVTRSITGLASSIRVAAECGKTQITPIYMTRAYLTRHGAGPLPFANITISDRDIPTDQTNLDNDWQGAIRNSPLQLKELKWYIEADLQRAVFASQIFGVEIKTPQLFITCMDQIGEVVNVINTKGKLHMVTKEFLPDYIEEELGIKVGFLSYGPTAANVVVR